MANTVITQAVFDAVAHQEYDNNPADATKSGYEDLQGSVASSRRLSARPPAERTFDYGITGGVGFLTDGFDVGEGTQITQQTFHKAMLLSEIDEHIHYTTPTDPTGKRMAWQMDVISACVGQPFAVVAGSPFTAEHIFTENQLGIHSLFDIAKVPAINSGVSCVYKVLLTRISSSQDEYADEIYVDYIDGHIKIDQPRGSREEVTK